MKYWQLALIILLTACGKGEMQVDSYEVIEGSIAVHGEPDDLYERYAKEFKGKKAFSVSDFKDAIAKYDKSHSNEDPIDEFLSSLPKSYRSKFSLVHRSFSIQKGTPMSPRVILFGQDASVMMTFNAGIDQHGKKMEGGEVIEAITWNKSDKTWDFMELEFKKDKSLVVKENPKKCVMCHSGTPKAITYDDADSYKGKLKPIFPQYPFWPGFYGSINDIVGMEGTIDTVLNDTNATMKHIHSLTFSDSEELFRLSDKLKKNPAYIELVKEEERIHKENFFPFMNSMKGRKRYQHLKTLKDLYTEVGDKVPDYLKAAPYRRTFDKEYGHYIFRPNFYLSSLMSFYHSQMVAKEILEFPEFSKFSKSLLAYKFNCHIPEDPELDYSRILPSFDLVYPNLSSEEAMDKQYLLSYQYNLVRSHKKGEAHVPLFAWNLESNEEIASYHYGNVFADLNELVLWRLAAAVYPEVNFEKGRDAAQERHYDIKGASLQPFLRGAGGIVSRFTTSQMNFTNAVKPFYNSKKNFKGQPVSNKCKNVFIPGAREELKELANEETLPHEKYPVDPILTDVIVVNGQKKSMNVTQNVRHNCESCHSSQDLISELDSHIQPQFNVDWYSDSFAEGLKVDNLASRYLEALSTDTLPVPFGKRMPFGRRAITGLAKTCEEQIVKRNFDSPHSLGFKVWQCDKENDPDSIDCACETWGKRKWRAFKKFYR